MSYYITDMTCTNYFCIYFWDGGGRGGGGRIGLPGYDTAIFTSFSWDLVPHRFLSLSKFNVYIADRQITAGSPIATALTAQ